MRRTTDGWRMWRGWHEWGGGFFGGFHIVDEAAQVAGLRESADRVVTWPADSTAPGANAAPVAPGRAFIEGYAGGMTPARALVIEMVPHPGAPPVRVEIPVSGFNELMMLMGPWPSVRDWTEAQRRTAPVRKER